MARQLSMLEMTREATGLSLSKIHQLRKSQMYQKTTTGVNRKDALSEVELIQCDKKDKTELCTVRGKPKEVEKCWRIFFVKGHSMNK